MTCPADSFALSVFFSVVYDPEITDAFFCLLYHLLLKRPAKVVYMTVEKRYACHSSYIAAIVEQNWKHLTRKRENGQNLLLLLYCTIKENCLFLVLVKFPTQRFNRSRVPPPPSPLQKTIVINHNVHGKQQGNAFEMGVAFIVQTTTERH